jgi:glycosyltransferase involved in cell wall biosynthesis
MHVLMVGTVNSPHVRDLALQLAPALDEVTIAGWISPSLPPPAPPPGIRVLIMPRRSLSRIGAPFKIIWQARTFRRLRPDLVHVHGATELAVAAVRASARPLLITVWGSEVLTAVEKHRRVAAKALAHADAFTVDSPLLLEQCVQLGATRERGRLVGWGVDLSTFRPVPGGRNAARRRLGLPDGRLILSSRASDPTYNTAEIVEAFDRLADEDPELQLAVRQLDDGRGVIPESRHPERVHVISYLARDRLPDLYAAADVCVSVPSSDSAPRSVWEAMACGCACVLSDLPWLDGMVRPDEEALVTAPNAPGIAAALRRLLDDPKLARAISDRARSVVEREHDQTDQRSRWLTLYRELTSRSSASA